MPTLPIPLFTRSYKNVDGTVLIDDAAIQYNGYIDEMQGLNIRPGEVLAINSARTPDGMFFWPDKNYIICVEEAYVTLRTIVGETLVDYSASALSTLTKRSPVIFANDGDTVFMADGGKINYVDMAGAVTELADPQAPTNVSHVGYLDGYILAINNDNKFYWSDIPTTTDWSALSFASAEANPDITQALYVVQRQILLIGTTTTEIWENDGSTPFSRIPGGVLEVGCIAKYSPIRKEDSLIWLNQHRQFVEFNGTGIKILSTRYDLEVANFAIVSDCIGGRILKDGQEYYLFQFPSEQRTLVYNPKIDDWSEWGVWMTGPMQWLPYDFRAVAQDLETGKTFIGKENAKVIACLKSSSRVDLTGASTSERFKFLRQTGWISHGSPSKKRLESLYFRAKRGSGDATNPVLMLRYRNNGSSTWSNIKEIDLGNIGDTMFQIKLRRLGIFESRQYEISASDNVPIVLSNAEADITVLR